MSLRKQFILIMLLLVVVATGLHSLISGNYIDQYFRGFVKFQYENQVEKISDYATILLQEPNPDLQSAARNLTQYMEDPITKIVLFDTKGTEILSVEYSGTEGMMHGQMMRGRRFQNQQDSDQYPLAFEGTRIGSLTIYRNAAIAGSQSVLLFKQALTMGSLLSGGIVLIFAIGIAIWISRKMTKDLKETADFASALQTSDHSLLDTGRSSKIVEINAIQMSLRDLSAKLKLQHQIQKERADQLTHEARTPITLLKTHVEGVLDGVVEMDPSRLESCLHEIDTLSQVISNIAGVIDIKDDSLAVTPVTFDLIADLKKIINGMRMILSQKDIELQLAMPSELILESDRVLVSQVLYNLLTNASKFTPAGGKIELNVKPLLSSDESSDSTGVERISITVSDTGPGIPAEQLGYVFNAYYRGPEVSHLQGEGLGLFIAKRNADLLKGSLCVESPPEQGATFIFKIPVKLEAPSQGEA